MTLAAAGEGEKESLDTSSESSTDQVTKWNPTMLVA